MLRKCSLHSSAINSVSYDDSTRILTIEFKGNREYDYPDVPEEHFRGIVSAESAGRYFNQFIKSYGGAK